MRRRAEHPRGVDRRAGLSGPSGRNGRGTAPPDGGPLRPSGRRVAPRRTAAASLGVTPAQLVIVASIVQKEGVYQKNMGKVARVIYNRLAKGTPLQMDSTVLYSLGQDGGPVTAGRPGPQHPLQHLPAHRAPAHRHLHPVARRPSKRRPTPRRGRGCTSSWSRRTAPSSSPTPTPSSWPRRRSPRAGACRERAYRAAPGPRPRPPSWSASWAIPSRHSLSPLLHNTAFAALGLDWVSVAFPVPAGGSRRRHCCAGPARDRRGVGDHAAQGQRRGRLVDECTPIARASRTR